MGSGMNYEHKATPLQAWCDALAFVEHTAKIIGNPKHFNPSVYCARWTVSTTTSKWR